MIKNKNKNPILKQKLTCSIRGCKRYAVIIFGGKAFCRSHNPRLIQRRQRK